MHTGLKLIFFAFSELITDVRVDVIRVILFQPPTCIRPPCSVEGTKNYQGLSKQERDAQWTINTL